MSGNPSPPARIAFHPEPNLALIAGNILQKTEAIWASALFHAGADTLIVIGMFAGVKT